ncbi:MAG TPA: UDP-N-acetylmuramate--L-alanine ligase [Acidimicrobiia bacterium]|nr:UDP-N-acetylmuramate--L-alanine ligase [Acidimicrobiia bacterium]HZQ78435.1 UDP-N-acetylmuramate--L-alanine ligase [Acidimicrobiia bacterium]
MTLDLSAPRRIHIVGIGGMAMSGIAAVLTRLGHTVSGSDLKAWRGLERLRLMGVDVHVPHDAGCLPAELDAVVVSTAIPPTNPEVMAAREQGVPVLRRAEALAAIVDTRRTVAISGTHGKTTTSTMTTLILRAAGWHPSFLIGGEPNEVGSNAAYDDGEWLVIEADESDGTFVEIAPEAVVLTNVEPDHLDHYGDMAALEEACARYLASAPGPRVACADDPGAARLAARVTAGGRPVVTYGDAAGADYRIENYRPLGAGPDRGPEGPRVPSGGFGSRFDLVRRGETLGEIRLPAPGRHNARNAAGAAAVATEIGVPFDAVRAALGRFAGVARRFQFHGEVGGVTLVDDYAHLPGEIKATLSAAREGDWRRIVAVFQPHRYTRTARLWRDFGDAFADADVVVLTDVYAAGEAPQPGVSGRLILQAVCEAHPPGRVLYVPKRADVLALLPELTRPGDLVVTLGAGDITSLPDEWLRRADA